MFGFVLFLTCGMFYLCLLLKLKSGSRRHFCSVATIFPEVLFYYKHFFYVRTVTQKCVTEAWKGNRGRGNFVMYLILEKIQYRRLGHFYLILCLLYIDVILMHRASNDGAQKPNCDRCIYRSGNYVEESISVVLH